MMIHEKEEFFGIELTVYEGAKPMPKTETNKAVTVSNADAVKTETQHIVDSLVAKVVVGTLTVDDVISIAFHAFLQIEDAAKVALAAPKAKTKKEGASNA